MVSRAYHTLQKERDALLAKYKEVDNSEKPRILVKIMDLEKEMEDASKLEEKENKEKSGS